MSQGSTAVQHPAQSRVPWATDLVIVAAAAVCAWITWWFAVRVGDIDLFVPAASGDQRVGGIAVVVTAGSSALVGVLALRVMEARIQHALRAWTVLAILLALVSILGPLSAVTLQAKGTLLGLHAVVAAVVIVAVHRSRATLPSHRPPGPVRN